MNAESQVIKIFIWCWSKNCFILIVRLAVKFYNLVWNINNRTNISIFIIVDKRKLHSKIPKAFYSLYHRSTFPVLCRYYVQLHFPSGFSSQSEWQAARLVVCLTIDDGCLGVILWWHKPSWLSVYWEVN